MLQQGVEVGMFDSLFVHWQSVEHLRYYAGWADKIYGQTIPTEGKMHAYTLREPIGEDSPWL